VMWAFCVFSCGTDVPFLLPGGVVKFHLQEGFSFGTIVCFFESLREGVLLWS